MSDTPSERPFGWCASPGRADQFHALCPVRFVSAVGVTHTCSCPNHDLDEEADA